MLAPAPGSRETLKLEAVDLRADGRRRTVSVSAEGVVISRQREGVAMRIALRLQAFHGVLLRLTSFEEGGYGYEVQLVHADPDLSVALLRSFDESEAHRAWRSWVRYVGARALVERVVGEYEEVYLGAQRVGAFERRRGRGVGPRRPRFLARRKPGRAELAKVLDGACELFGAWREGV